MKRLPWRVVLPCRYQWSCWQPGCVYERDQGWDRQDVVDLWAEAAAVSGSAAAARARLVEIPKHSAATVIEVAESGS